MSPVPPPLFGPFMEISHTVETLDSAAAWSHLARVLGGAGLDVVRNTIRHLRVLDAKCYVLEDPYIDRDYSTDYAQFYALTFHAHERHCNRVHFFSQDISPLLQRPISTARLNDLGDLAKDAYCGFCVVRPLSSAPIGRTVLLARVGNGFNMEAMSTSVPDYDRRDLCPVRDCPVPDRRRSPARRDHSPGECRVRGVDKVIHHSYANPLRGRPAHAEKPNEEQATDSSRCPSHHQVLHVGEPRSQPGPLPIQDDPMRRHRRLIRMIPGRSMAQRSFQPQQARFYRLLHRIGKPHRHSCSVQVLLKQMQRRLRPLVVADARS